jgi:hypothetical protein
MGAGRVKNGPASNNIGPIQTAPLPENGLVRGPGILAVTPALARTRLIDLIREPRTARGIQ